MIAPRLRTKALSAAFNYKKAGVDGAACFCFGCAATTIVMAAGAPAGAQQQTTGGLMDGMSLLGTETQGLVLTKEQVLQV